MPVEHDDEATTFDPQPWGAMQRVKPSPRFSAGVRTSGPLQPASVGEVEPLLRSPRAALASVAAPAAAFAISPGSLHTAHVTFGSTAPSPTRTTVPLDKLPLTAFAADIDCTLRVRRRPLTVRSLLAVPLGAALAAVLILIATANPSSSATAVAAAAAPMHMTAAPELPMLAPAFADIAASAMTAGSDATLDAEPPPTLLAARALPAITKQAAAPAAPAAKKRFTSKRAPRPRKIVAVDASTPLGNLRPSRF